MDLFNALVAAIRLKDYLPGRVHLLCENRRYHHLDTLRGGIQEVISGYGGRAEVVPLLMEGDDFVLWGRKVAEIVKREKGEGNTVALDVSTGMTSVAIGSVLAAWGHGIDHIFLLDLEEFEGTGAFVMELPMSKVKMHDFVREAEGYVVS